MTVTNFIALAPAPTVEVEDVSSMRFQAVAVFLVIAISIGAVLFNFRRSSKGGASSLRLKKRKSFDLSVAKMDDLSLSTIASLVAGPAHIEGTVHSSVEKLGGAPGEEIVYMDKSGGGKQTAVASELIVVADATGRVGVVNLERARVLGPREDVGKKSFLTIRVGDRVQVLGRFRVDRHGEDMPAQAQIYGLFGHDGPAQVKVLQRGDQVAVRSGPQPDVEHASPIAQPPAPDATNPEQVAPAST